MNEFEKASNEIDERTGDSNDENVFESQDDKDIMYYAPNSQKLMTVAVTRKRWVNKIEQYAKDYPDEVQIKHRDKCGTVVAHIPVSYFRITRPVERELTEEQKEELTERLKAARDKKNI